MAGWDNPMREFERLRVENAGLRAEVARLREGVEALAEAGEFDEIEEKWVRAADLRRILDRGRS